MSAQLATEDKSGGGEGARTKKKTLEKEIRKERSDVIIPPSSVMCILYASCVGGLQVPDISNGEAGVSEPPHSSRP